MKGDEPVLAGDHGLRGRSPFERLADKFGDDFASLEKSAFLLRGALGTAADAWHRALLRGTRAEKTVTRAAFVFLEFVWGVLWFLVYGVSILLYPGDVDVGSSDHGDEQEDE